MTKSTAIFDDSDENEANGCDGIHRCLFSLLWKPDNTHKQTKNVVDHNTIFIITETPIADDHLRQLLSLFTIRRYKYIQYLFYLHQLLNRCYLLFST